MLRKPRISFSFEVDEKLIKLVYANEELYDISSKRYSDAGYKNKIWKEIGKKLLQDPEVCKQRWESLRSQYRKIRRTRIAKTGHVAVAESENKWKYEDHFEFLLPHIQNYHWFPSFADDTYMSEDKEMAPEEDENSTDMESEACLPQPIQNSVTIEKNQTTVVEQVKKIKPKVKKRPPAIDETTASMLLNYLIEEEKKKSAQIESKDALDYFFDTMKCTVKQFSDTDKHLVKQRIFNIVSEIEGKYVSESSNSTTSSANAINHS